MPTPNYGFPFPSLGDVPNIPADIEALAEAVDTELARVDQELTDTNIANKAILHGMGLTDATGTAVLTFPAGTFAATPNLLLTVLEKTNVTIRARGGGTSTSMTVNTNNGSTGAAAADCYFFWLAIGARP